MLGGRDENMVQFTADGGHGIARRGEDNCSPRWWRLAPAVRSMQTTFKTLLLTVVSVCCVCLVYDVGGKGLLSPTLVSVLITPVTKYEVEPTMSFGVPRCALQLKIHRREKRKGLPISVFIQRSFQVTQVMKANNMHIYVEHPNMHGFIAPFQDVIRFRVASPGARGIGCARGEEDDIAGWRECEVQGEQGGVPARTSRTTHYCLI